MLLSRYFDHCNRLFYVRFVPWLLSIVNYQFASASVCYF
nr:MAG TPA: hypothetical protein [Caudoviricetes sp.]